MMFVLDDIWVSVCSDLGDRWFFLSHLCKSDLKDDCSKWPFYPLSRIAPTLFNFNGDCVRNFSAVNRFMVACNRSHSFFMHLEAWNESPEPWNQSQTSRSDPLKLWNESPLCWTSLEPFWQVGEWNQSLLCGSDPFSRLHVW